MVDRSELSSSLRVLACLVTLTTIWPQSVRAEDGDTSAGPEMPDPEGPSKAPDAPDVGSSGTFSHSIPLKLPPGRRGMAPALALTYSAGAPSGLFGVGWGLSGLPAVVRVNTGRGVQFLSTDSYTLVGSWFEAPDPRRRFVAIGSNQFHMAQDSRQRFEPIGTCGSGQPCAWRMRDGAGTTYYFGHTTATQYLPSGAASIPHSSVGGATASVVAWGLSRVEDDHGNAYEVEYLDEPGHLYPKRIVWTLPIANNASVSLHEVQFDYAGAARPDMPAAPAFAARRIHTIRQLTGTREVRRWELEYGAPSPSSGRSLLRSVQEVGEGSLLGTKQLLEYSGAQPAVVPFDASTGVAALAPGFDVRSTYLPDLRDLRWTSLVGDVNADGRDDLVRVFPSPLNSELSLPCGGSAFTGARRLSRVQISFGQARGGVPLADPIAVAADRDFVCHFPATNEHGADLADINGDGHADLVQYVHGQTSIRFQYRLGGPTGLGALREGPTLLWAPVHAEIPIIPNTLRVIRGDFNGDQLADFALLFLKRGGIEGRRMVVFTGDADANLVARPATPWPFLPVVDGEKFRDSRSADINGDGFDDVVVLYSTSRGGAAAPRVRVAVGWGDAFGIASITESVYAPSLQAEAPFAFATGNPGQELALGDYDGDGTTDVVIVATGGNAGQQKYWARIKGLSPTAAGSLVDIASVASAAPSYGFNDVSRAASPLPKYARYATVPADIDGDGRADLLSLYRGTRGFDRQWARQGTAGGLWADATSPERALRETSTNPDFDGPAWGDQWHYAVGDANGDGLTDVFPWSWIETDGQTAYTYLDGMMGQSALASTRSLIFRYYEITRGRGRLTNPAFATTASALCNGGGCAPEPPPQRDRHIGQYNKDNVHVEVGDFNGDGRSDLVWMDNGIMEPDEFPFSMVVWPSRAGPNPDLLVRIDNGGGGTISVDYASSTDYPSAVQPARPWTARLQDGWTVAAPQCGGVRWYEEAPLPPATANRDVFRRCGVPRARPVTVVASIRHDNGQGVTRTWSYHYENARIRLGDVLTRQNIGFEVVRRYSDDALTELVSTFDQTESHSGKPIQVDERDAWTDVTRVSKTYQYEVLYPYGGSTITLSEQRNSEAHEWDDSGELERIVRESVLERDGLGLPTKSERCVESGPRQDCQQSYTAYSPPDLINYWIGRVWMQWSTSGSGQGIDAQRFSYWPGFASDVRKVERLYFADSDKWLCDAPTEVTDLCQREIVSGLARWIPVARYTQVVNGVEQPGYDSYGLTTHEVDAVGAVTVTSYDLAFRTLPASQTNALQQLVRREYDWAGRLRFEYDVNSNRTTYEYDALGRLSKRLLPLAGVTSASPSDLYEYLDQGQPGLQRVKVTRRISSADSRWAVSWLDGFGDVYATQTSSSGAASVLQRHLTTLSGAVAWKYDTGYQLWPNNAPAPTTSIRFAARRFDNASRLQEELEMSAAGGAMPTLQVGLKPLKATYTDNMGRDTVKTFDLHRRLASVTDTGGGVLEYFYDDVGNLRTVTRPALGAVSMTYDSFGRLTSQTQPETGRTEYEYDDVGRLTTTRRSHGRRVVTTFDAIGRPRTTSHDGVQVASYTYDAPVAGAPAVANAVGQLVETTYTLGTTAQTGRTRVLEYDALGRVRRVERSVNGTAGTLSYTYDDLGRVTEKAFPDGSRQWDDYYAKGGPLKRVRAQVGGVTTTVADFVLYKPNGQLELMRSGGLTKRYVYDGFDRLYTMDARTAPGVVVQSYRYGYDGVGNPTRIEDLRASKLVGGVDTSEDQSLGYDSLYRLISANTLAAGGANYTFDYDAGGNIKLKDGVTRDYGLCTIGLADRCITGRSGTTQVWRAVHDVAGERRAMELTSSGERWDYDYDAEGRLTWGRRRALAGGAVKSSVALSYDASGSRVRKIYTDPVAATTTTIWLSDDYELRTTSRGAGTSVTRHIVTPDGRRLASYTDGAMLPGQLAVSALPPLLSGPWSGSTRDSVPAGWVFLHGNHLGSSSVTTNATGAVLSRTAYAPYGEIIPGRSRGTDATTLKFAGLELDEESGLHFAQARYYDTLTARFLTADTVTPGEGKSSQGWNRYAYSNNSPVTYVDPSGHVFEPKFHTTALKGLAEALTAAAGELADDAMSRVKPYAQDGVDYAMGIAAGYGGGDGGAPFGNTGIYGAGMVLGAVTGGAMDVYAGVTGLKAAFGGGGLVLATGGMAAPAGGAVALTGAGMVGVAVTAAVMHAKAAGRGLELMEEGGRKAPMESRSAEGTGAARDALSSGRKLTEHADMRMRTRGFSDDVVESIITNNKRGRQSKIDADGRKTWEYRDARGNTVVTNEAGDVVTVFSPDEGGAYIPKPRPTGSE
jgi:RHS repeat-associated protein